MATYSPSKITKDGNTYNFTDNTKIPLSGTNALAGSIIPSTDNSYDFGSSTYKLRYVYCGTAYVTNLNINGKTIGTDANSNMTYDGHIVETIEEQGSDYIRYASGLQICWGEYPATSETEITINFPKAFYLGSPLSVSVEGQSLSLYVVGWTANTIIIRNTNTGAFTYTAIGRWK